MAKILVSSCLVGKKCTYDGQTRTHREIVELCGREGYIDVCPELLGGLGVPRERCEISGGSGEDVLGGKAKVISESGEDKSENYILGAREALKAAKAHNIDVAILKENSPSCGSSMIRTGSFNGELREGKGVTAALLSESGITVFSENALGAVKEHLGEQGKHRA